MVNDRGTIKWSTMMLPEHAEELRKLWEKDKEVEKPLLDIQQINFINRLLAHAYTKQAEVKITLYESKRIKEKFGKVKKIDRVKGLVHLKETNGEIYHLPFRQITDIQLESDF